MHSSDVATELKLGWSPNPGWKDFLPPVNSHIRRQFLLSIFNCVSFCSWLYFPCSHLKPSFMTTVFFTMKLVWICNFTGSASSCFSEFSLYFQSMLWKEEIWRRSKWARLSEITAGCHANKRNASYTANRRKLSGMEVRMAALTGRVSCEGNEISLVVSSEHAQPETVP